MAKPSATACRRAAGTALLAGLLLVPLAGCEDQGDVARLEARTRALEAQLAAQRKAAADRLDGALKRIAALERRARSGDDRVAAMAMGQVDAERRDKAVRAALDELRSVLAALERRTKALADGAATTARADAAAIRKLRERLDALDARTAPLEKSVSGAESDVALLRTRVATLGRQIESLLAAMAPSAKTNQEQDKRIESLARAIGQIAALVREIARSSSSLAEKIGPLKADTKEAASRLRTLTAAMGALRVAVERAEAKVARLEQRIRALDAERKR